MALNEKGLGVIKGWVTELGARDAAFKMINHNLSKLAMGLDVNDLPDTMTLANGLDTIEEMLNAADFVNAWDEAKMTAREMLEDEGFPGMFENKKLKENKKMKRVRYKTEFKSIEDALTKVPNQLKENNEVFEMTDGNKTIQVRWEGTLEEGMAVPLTEVDNTLISEDISKMKNLMGYKSEKTIGTPTANNRVSENKTFRDLLSTAKKKSLNESINIDEIAGLHESELLDEGLMSKLGKIAVMLGLSIASFTAMAQESPKKAVEVLKQKASKLTPEQLDNITNATGIEFTTDTANDLFQWDNNSFTPQPVPDLYLGKYGDIEAAKVIDKQRDNNGNISYTVQVNKTYSNDSNFSTIRSYIGNQNKKLKGATIKFVDYKGSSYGGKEITYK